MREAAVRLPKKKIPDFCKKNHIRRLALFGSVLRNDFNADSDVDFLVEFDPRHVPGLIRLASMEKELTAIIGRKADLRTPRDLSRYFRNDVMKTAQIQYAEN